MSDNKLFLKKGLWLGIILIVIHKIFSSFLLETYVFGSPYRYVIGIVFGLVVLSFLITQKASDFFITGFTGLFVLIGTEIILGSTGIGERLFEPLMGSNYYYSGTWAPTYLFGFLGSMLGTAIAFVLTLLKFKLNFLPKRGVRFIKKPIKMNLQRSEIFVGKPIKMKLHRKGLYMKKSIKTKLLAYILVSALSFTYLILPENAGISVPVFAVLQFLCLWFVVPNRNKLWLFIPIFILSLNSFISGNAIWRIPNVIVSIILYGVMFIDFDIKDTTSRFLIDILENVIEPIFHFQLPFKWALNANKEKAPIVKRVLIAVSITLPCLAILVVTLSVADMVFSKGVSDFFAELLRYINFNVVFKMIYGFVVGLYLFGIIYSSYFKKDRENIKANAKQGDLIILNILLISILTIYTIFVVIQFKYLFSGATLPYGLTYAEYARKGFFELFALTGVNIAVILITVHLTKEMQSAWGRITKWLCCYFCAITIVLLISSLYRMWLYNADDGLTRLRFLVFGFLIFESIGLIITFFYIFKPKFNIIAVYSSIGLIYYLLLNIVPMDYYVAKSQVDRYLNGSNAGIPYTITLSADAAPQIERILYGDIYKNTVEEKIKKQIYCYFENQNKYYDILVPRWQLYNLSVNKTQQIYRTIIRDSFELNKLN